MTLYLDDPDFQLHLGDVREVLRSLPAGSVNCCVTSPPYWGLRDYGSDGQIGLEDSPDAFVAVMVDVFREVRRVLADDRSGSTSATRTTPITVTAVRPAVRSKGVGSISLAAPMFRRDQV